MLLSTSKDNLYKTINNKNDNQPEGDGSHVQYERYGSEGRHGAWGKYPIYSLNPPYGRMPLASRRINVRPKIHGHNVYYRPHNSLHAIDNLEKILENSLKRVGTPYLNYDYKNEANIFQSKNLHDLELSFSSKNLNPECLKNIHHYLPYLTLSRSTPKDNDFNFEYFDDEVVEILSSLMPTVTTLLTTSSSTSETPIYFTKVTSTQTLTTFVTSTKVVINTRTATPAVQDTLSELMTVIIASESMISKVAEELGEKKLMNSANLDETFIYSKEDVLTSEIKQREDIIEPLAPSSDVIVLKNQDDLHEELSSVLDTLMSLSQSTKEQDERIDNPRSIESLKKVPFTQYPVTRIKLHYPFLKNYNPSSSNDKQRFIISAKNHLLKK